MKPKAPLFPPPKDKDKKENRADPWVQIQSLTDKYGSQIEGLLDNAKAVTKAMTECLEHVYTQVHNPRAGEDGNVHLEEFSHADFEKMVKTVLDLYLFQELSNMFGLEKPVKARAMEAFILRHSSLRPLTPRTRGPQQQLPSTTTVFRETSKPSPPQRERAKMWSGKKE